jgi:GR25 family glycosyltransferase involved in LPS biosynthesis
MKLNEHFSDVNIHVINLIERNDKKLYIEKQLKVLGLEYKLFSAKKHQNPKRGCLESHLTIIKNAQKGNEKQILILEDDAKFIHSYKALKSPPPNWDMIYLGGTCHRIMDRKYSGYARVQTWTTHAYIINLENKNLINKLVTDLENYEGEIDRYYLDKIHPNFNVYMCDPMIVIQKEGFSDIEGKEVNYDFMQHTLKGLRLPESSVDNEGNYVLKLPNISLNELPYISIITPTYKRRKLFSIALRNFDNFIYPKEKIEWVIIDDSPEEDCIKDLIPRDKRIKYIHMDNGDEPMTIAMKRNIAVSNSSHQYILHMDDDDYYPPESILARIKILIKYKGDGIQCVGSTLIGTYNIITDISSMSSDGPISLSEASMAYTKKFWEDRPFDETCLRGEHKYFTEQRLDKIIDMPYSFILIAMNHKNNFTNELRSDNISTLKFSEQSGKEGQIANFFDTWDDEMQMFIIEFRNYLLK